MNESKKNITTSTSDDKISKFKSSTKSLDVIIGGAIFLIFFLVPIFFTGKAAQGFGFEKMVLFYFLVLIGVVAWVTKGVIVGELNLIRTPLDIPILATLVMFVLSTVFSISVKDSVVGAYGSSSKGLAAMVVFVLFYYLVVNNLTISRIKNIFWAIVSSGILLIIVSLLQLKSVFLFGFIPETKVASFNPIGSLSGLVMYLMMILPILVVATAQTGQIFPKLRKEVVIVIKALLKIGILGLFLILMYLNGFAFWPIPVIGIVIILMFFMAKIIKISTSNLLIPLTVFLALIIFLVMGKFDFGGLNLPAEVSLSRGASWDIAKSSIRENPIFGSGPSTFYYSFSKFKNSNFNASPLWNIRFDSATGSLYELIATVGLFGTIGVVTLILIALSTLFLTLIKTNNEETNSILLGLFSSFISSILLSVLFPQNNSLIILSVMISVFAVSASLILYPEKFKNIKLSFRASAKYALALAAIFLFVSSGVVILFTMGLKMYMADAYAKESTLVADNNVKIEKLEKAIAMTPYQDAYYLSVASSYMALANQEATSGQDQSKIGDNLGKAIELGKKAVEISPNNASNNESLALIYENASFYTRGALEWAEDLYKKVIELDPHNPTPYLRTALVNMARANAETDDNEKKYFIGEAIKKYDESIAKKSDLAAAYYGKAIASEKLGKIDDSIEQLKNANLISRNNLDYRFELGRLYFNRGVSNPKIKQDNPQKIAENDIAGENSAGNLSVDSQASGGVIEKSSDLNTAEQLFLSILLPTEQGGNPNHANARYSLAVLYQKVGDNEKAKIMAETLLNILTDDQTKSAVREQFKGLLK